MFRHLPVLLIAILASVHGSVYRVKVQGQLNCMGEPAEGIKVKLYDINIGTDTEMDGKITDKNGSFSLDGSSSQLLGKISPVLKIYHKCNTGLLTICDRRWVYKIPKEYIFDKNDPKLKTVNFGVAELSLTPAEEDKKCLPVNVKTHKGSKNATL